MSVNFGECYASKMQLLRYCSYVRLLQLMAVSDYFVEVAHIIALSYGDHYHDPQDHLTLLASQ